MALTVLSLGDGQIPNADTINDLYTVPAGLSAIVKTMRFVNTDTASRNINVYFKRSGQTAPAVLPVDVAVAAGNLILEDREITMGAGDKIQAKASVANKIDWVISGVERDA